VSGESVRLLKLRLLLLKHEFHGPGDVSNQRPWTGHHLNHILDVLPQLRLVLSHSQQLREGQCGWSGRFGGVVSGTPLEV
jgi:hypothetical protein